MNLTSNTRIYKDKQEARIQPSLLRAQEWHVFPAIQIDLFECCSKLSENFQLPHHLHSNQFNAQHLIPSTRKERTHYSPYMHTDEQIQMYAEKPKLRVLLFTQNQMNPKKPNIKFNRNKQKIHKALPLHIPGRGKFLKVSKVKDLTWSISSSVTPSCSSSSLRGRRVCSEGSGFLVFSLFLKRLRRNHEDKSIGD